MDRDLPVYVCQGSPDRRFHLLWRASSSKNNRVDTPGKLLAWEVENGIRIRSRSLFCVANYADDFPDDSPWPFAGLHPFSNRFLAREKTPGERLVHNHYGWGACGVP